MVVPSLTTTGFCTFRRADSLKIVLSTYGGSCCLVISLCRFINLDFWGNTTFLPINYTEISQEL